MRQVKITVVVITTNLSFSGEQIQNNIFSQVPGDVNQDGIINILDVIMLVSEILGTTFGQSVDWLRENFPELEVDRRLGELDKSIDFSK